jgi:hypothetical protein
MADQHLVCIIDGGGKVSAHNQKKYAQERFYEALSGLSASRHLLLLLFRWCGVYSTD